MPTPGQSDGLIYLHGRYYDPQLMRFTSPDPYTPAMGNLGLNRYAYVANSPVNATDPSGYGSNEDKDTIRRLEANNARLRAENARLSVSPLSGLPRDMPNLDFVRDSEGRRVLFVYADAFNFKNVNKLGDAVGNAEIRRFGQILKTAVGDIGIVTHPHGDTFIIVSTYDNLDQMKARLEAAQKQSFKTITGVTKGGQAISAPTGLNIGYGETSFKAEQDQELQKDKMYTDRGMNRRGGIDRRRPPAPGSRFCATCSSRWSRGGPIGGAGGRGALFGIGIEFLMAFSPEPVAPIPRYQPIFNINGPAVSAPPDAVMGPSTVPPGWKLSTGTYGTSGYICWVGPGC